MKAIWTVAQDGRHAVELEPVEGSSDIAVYRFLSPVGRARFHIDVNVIKLLPHRYGIDATTGVPAWSFTKTPPAFHCGFHAYDDESARTVLRGIAKAWAMGRIPLTPGTRVHATAWKIYIDATADAAMVRRARTLRP